MKPYKVICNNNHGVQYQLTVGHTYVVSNENDDRLYLEGLIGWFYRSRFVRVEETVTQFIIKTTSRHAAERVTVALLDKFNFPSRFEPDGDSFAVHMTLNTSDLFAHIKAIAYAEGFLAALP